MRVAMLALDGMFDMGLTVPLALLTRADEVIE